MKAVISHVEFRAALRACELSQKQIVHMTGRTVGMVSKWATGTHPIPQYIASLLILQNTEDARIDMKDFSGDSFQASFLFEWYEVLGLSVTATLADAKAARNELAKKYHPDMDRPGADVSQRGFASASIMSRISAAYEDAKKMIGALGDTDAGTTVGANTEPSIRRRAA